MRIALTNPFSWPEVRRGSERLLHDLSKYLVGRGHRVTVIASHTEDTATYQEDGVLQIRVRQRLQGYGGRWLSPPHAFALQAHRILRKSKYDVVHSLSYFDAFGAAHALRESPETRFIMHIVGIAVRRHFRSIPHDRLMLQYGLRRAERIISVSHFSHDMLRDEFGYDSIVIPPIVDLLNFTPKVSVVDGPPRILFVGDIEESRKGAGALIKAIPRVRAMHPGAEFTFSGRVGGRRKQELLNQLDPEQRRGVTFLGVGEQSDLPELYRSASVVALPSIWEALGIVLAESMACGTPVVGCAHGGITDIVNSPRVGRTFPPQSLRSETPNIDGLVQALLETVELARDPATIAACRKRVQEFHVDRIGARIEAVYTQ